MPKKPMPRADPEALRKAREWHEQREQAVRDRWISLFRDVIADDCREALAMLDAAGLQRPRWRSE